MLRTPELGIQINPYVFQKVRGPRHTVSSVLLFILCPSCWLSRTSKFHVVLPFAAPNRQSATMSDVEKSISGEQSPEHVEHHGGITAAGVAQGLDDPSYVDHRADDDRGDIAKGRNSDKYDKKYWLSVNYIGTLFAIGMAFMGGIGGEQTRREHARFESRTDFIPSLSSVCRLWFDCSGARRHQR